VITGKRAMHNRQKQLYCGRSFALDLSLLNANSGAPVTAVSNDRGMRQG